MQTSNISESILSTSTGWFRYNYDEKRLEFINHNTKLVTLTWDIPIDQWEALPSQKEYCEHIVQKAKNQTESDRKSRSKLSIIGTVAVIIAIVCLLFIKKVPTMNNEQWFWILIVFSIAVPIAARTLNHAFRN